MAIERSEADGIVEIRIDRTPVNALDRATIDALRQTFEAVAAHPPAKGVVLTGAGKLFSAGVDVRAYAAYSPAEQRALAGAITDMTGAIRALDCPLVAAINGHALGGGLVLALCADWRIAVDDAAIKLGLPEAAAGVPFPDGPLAILKRELPPPLARHMALSSASLSPQQLHDWRVIDELVAADALMEAAQARVRQLAGQPAFVEVKRQMR